jgi:hypothetical protein
MNEFNKFKIFNFIFSAVFVLEKQCLLQAYFRPLGLQKVEVPNNRQVKVVRLSALSTGLAPPLPPGNISATHYC